MRSTSIGSLRVPLTRVPILHHQVQGMGKMTKSAVMIVPPLWRAEISITIREEESLERPTLTRLRGIPASSCRVLRERYYSSTSDVDGA
jgi:hypothetical protein